MKTQKKKFYGWNMVGALWIIYFINMGFALYGGTIISSNMLNEIKMDRSMYGMGFSLQNLFVAIPSMLIAASIMKFGIKKTYVIGSGLIIIGSLWMAAASKPWQFLVGVGVIIGCGIGFGTVIPTTTAVARWFNRYRGRVMAFTIAAPAVAGLIISPWIQSIITQNGGNWRLGWVICAGAVFVSAIIAILFIKDSPESIGQEPDGDVTMNLSADANSIKKETTTYDWTPRQAYKTVSYWSIIIGACATQYPFFFFVAHWVLYMEGLKFSIAISAFTMGIYTISSLFGRLIGGWLMDTVEARIAFISGLVFYVIGSIISINMVQGNLAMAYAASAFYGLAFGWAFVCMQTITANFYGRKPYPKLNGMVMLISGTLCAPAALIAGKLFDIYKNYTVSFMVNIVIVIIGIIALFFAKMPKVEKQK